MIDEVQELVTRALRCARHPELREHLRRCAATGSGLEDLYAASAAAVDPRSNSGDSAVSALLAKAINAALAGEDRAGRVGSLVMPRGPARVPVATHGRPALLAFERAPYDGAERETTLLLPKTDRPNAEATERSADAFFAAKAEVRVRPEAESQRIILEGDSSPRPRRELQAELVAACADGIAMLARHRDERPQSERDENEEALLAKVDAIGASGGECVRLLVEWWRQHGDAWSAWAATFALGCFAGVDALRAIAGALEELPSQGDTHVTAAAEALLVAPHPHTPELALDLVDSANPVARAIGLDFLGRRRLVSAEQVGRHLRDANTPVLAAALRASGVLGAASGVAIVLPFIHHPHQDVAWSATQRLMRWRRPEPYYAVREGRCPALGPKALEVLVQFGDASDIDCLEQTVARGPITTHVLSAIARFGEPSAWAYLAHHLADPELADAAARALTTLFGPLVRGREARSATAWRGAIAASQVVPGVRIRRGMPWRPAIVAAESRDGNGDRSEAEARIDELRARADVVLDVDLALWWSDVHAKLEPALAVAEQADATFRAGSWDCKAGGFRE